MHTLPYVQRHFNQQRKEDDNTYEDSRCGYLCLMPIQNITDKSDCFFETIDIEKLIFKPSAKEQSTTDSRRNEK